MKIKLDENLPLRLAGVLRNLKHDVHAVAEEGLVGCADNILWQTAQQESRLLITQDLEFSDTRRFIPGTHSGLLLVRLRSPDRMSLTQRVEDLFRREDVKTWNGCFVVATDRKVRITRPAV